MILPLNPAEVPTVTYEYMFCPLLSDQLWPPDRRRAWGLLSRSRTLGTMSHLLWLKILDTTSSLQ
jgi:hypothetical protein